MDKCGHHNNRHYYFAVKIAIIILFFIIIFYYTTEIVCGFCFMHLVQKSLTEVVNEWNSHRIRPSRNTCDPAGIPDQLFYMPASLGTP